MINHIPRQVVVDTINGPLVVPQFLPMTLELPAKLIGHSSNPSAHELLFFWTHEPSPLVLPPIFICTSLLFDADSEKLRHYPHQRLVQGETRYWQRSVGIASNSMRVWDVELIPHTRQVGPDP